MASLTQSLARRRDALQNHLASRCTDLSSSDGQWSVAVLQEKDLRWILLLNPILSDRVHRDRLLNAQHRHLYLCAMRSGSSRIQALLELDWSASTVVVTAASGKVGGLEAIFAAWRSHHRPGRLLLSLACVSSLATPDRAVLERHFAPDRDSLQGEWISSWDSSDHCATPSCPACGRV